MSGHDPSVVSRILSEADMAARPGQYDRLVAIANEVAALSAEINRMVGELSSIRMEHDAEVAALTRWKDEATEVIEAWERIHRLLGSPGFLGESKAAATYDEVRDLLGVRTEATNDRADAEFWEQRWREAADQREQMQAERDAARAEVERLRDAYEARDIALSEVAALRKQVVFLERHVNAEVDAGRDVLADLRAQVEGLRDEAKADPVGSAVWRTTAYESVLALIDGADHE